MSKLFKTKEKEKVIKDRYVIEEPVNEMCFDCSIRDTKEELRICDCENDEIAIVICDYLNSKEDLNSKDYSLRDRLIDS